MSLQLLGISYKTASVALREPMVLDSDAQKLFLARAVAAFPGSEWFVISTCNRTEYYWVPPSNSAVVLHDESLAPLSIASETDISANMISWLQQQLSLAQTHAYHLNGTAVVRHLIALLCGLDSMILGESQIVAQIKSAMDIARSANSLGKRLHILLQQALGFAKRIRRQTGIGDSPTSVAYTAVLLARSIFSDFAPLHVLLIGAGETAELTAWHLRQQGVTQMTILNRQVKKAHDLASKWQCRSGSLADVADVLPQADIVISATSSQNSMITQTMAIDALAKRRRPMYFIDLAMPRDIESAVGELTQAYLYNIDDLEQVVAEGLQGREKAALAAEPLIEKAVDAYAAHDASMAATDTILSLQTHAQTTRESELSRAKAMLARGEDIDVVLQQLTHRLSNKLLHQTLMLLKQLS